MDAPLKSLSEIADFLGAVPHRIIHLCETGLIKPAIDAVGRGKFRQFSRDNALRLEIALDLQKAGMQVEQLRPLMKAFDSFMTLKEIKAWRHQIVPFDFVEVVRRLGDDEPLSDSPALIWLSLPDGHPTFITPRFLGPSDRPGIRVSFATSLNHLVWTGPGIIVNLTSAASGSWLSWPKNFGL